MDRVRCAVIGSGNIGTDLLSKLSRSLVLEPVAMVGIDPTSDGLARARAQGLLTTAKGAFGLVSIVKERNVRIAFDATSASAHRANFEILAGLGLTMVDLTPAAIGPYCVPVVNLERLLQGCPSNVNMVTCGGQATIPIVFAVARVQAVNYAEIIATVASRSAGPGTRKNIDEFTCTTARALETVGGASRGKAIIIVNPAEPPLTMRDTIHCLTEETPDRERLTASVLEMVQSVQQYVPGYALKNPPIFDGKRVSIYLEVAGCGDYLPQYAGNLDIMTAAAVKTAEIIGLRI